MTNFLTGLLVQQSVDKGENCYDIPSGKIPLMNLASK